MNCRNCTNVGKCLLYRGRIFDCSKKATELAKFFLSCDYMVLLVKVDEYLYKKMCEHIAKSLHLGMVHRKNLGMEMGFKI